jgi:Dynamin family
MTDAGSALAGALDELAALGTAQDRDLIAALQGRLDAARLRVLVAGEAKRGKSTLVNALLGRVVLPAGVTPLTAVATTVRYGDDPRAEVRFADGHEDKQPMSALPDLVTERGNPGNRRRIASVTVYLDAPLLAGGVELVDTPGTGSVFAWDTTAAHEALETMDAAVFVLTADPPVSAAERDLYAKVTGLSAATAIPRPSCWAWTWRSRRSARGSPRTAGSSTPPPKTSGRPSCWPAPSAAASPASWAVAAPASTSAARSAAWWRARSAGPGRTCSTGCRRRPAPWPVPWGSGTQRRPAGCKPP